MASLSLPITLWNTTILIACVLYNYTDFFSSLKTFPVRISFRSASKNKSTPPVSCFERKSIRKRKLSYIYSIVYIYSLVSIVLRTYTFFSPTIIKFCKILLQTAFIMLNELVHYWDLCWLKYNHVTNDRTKNMDCINPNCFYSVRNLLLFWNEYILSTKRPDSKFKSRLPDWLLWTGTPIKKKPDLGGWSVR